MVSMFLIALALEVGANGPGDGTTLDVTEPVICVQVRGFRDYDERQTIELTSVDKLVVYDEPSHHRIVRDKDSMEYRAHLVEDAQIRRKGNPKPVRIQKGILDFAPRAKQPPESLYLVTEIRLKQLPPGEYELDLILKDALEPESQPVKKTVPFEIISAPPEE